MQYPFHSSRICTNCSSYQAAITDPESGEIICSNCGNMKDKFKPEDLTVY
jgi:transcription initiation factor TFIIIB Brf1 subunit/transcription initiation factor TFIIB